MDKLRSLNNRKFSYEQLKKFNASFISFIETVHFVKVVCSFLVVTISLNLNTMIPDPSLKSNKFINLPGILLFTCNIRPPPFLLLYFRNILYPSAKIWEFGNEPSILVSDNKQTSVSLRTRSLKLENLFLKELILRCLSITYLG